MSCKSQERTRGIQTRRKAKSIKNSLLGMVMIIIMILERKMQLNDMIIHLHTYHDLYALLASLIASLAAIGYVIIAFKLIKTNVQSRVQPNIIADMGVKGNSFYFVVTNTGEGIARNVTVNVDPPILLGTVQVKQINIESLTPQQQFYENYQMESEQDYRGLIQLNRVITVSYEDQFANSVTLERIFDNRLFDNESGIFTSPYQVIEERLEKIEKAIINHGRESNNDCGGRTKMSH